MCWVLRLLVSPSLLKARPSVCHWSEANLQREVSCGRDTPEQMGQMLALGPASKHWSPRKPPAQPWPFPEGKMGFLVASPRQPSPARHGFHFSLSLFCQSPLMLLFQTMHQLNNWVGEPLVPNLRPFCTPKDSAKTKTQCGVLDSSGPSCPALAHTVLGSSPGHQALGVCR